VNPIKSGFSLGKLFSGIILALVGTGVVATHHMVGIPLEIRGFIIPEWSILALSSVLFLSGVYLVVRSGRGDLCASCNRELKIVMASFSLRDGDKIVHAVLELDAGLIKDLRELKEGEPQVILNMCYCHACRRVARIAVKKEEKKRTTELVPERVVTGPPVWKFLDTIDKVREMEREKNQV
jgi:hypothetical protein